MKLRVLVRFGDKLSIEGKRAFANEDAVVTLTEPPEGNKANRQLIDFLTEVAGAPVKILAGFTDKVKLIEVPDTAAFRIAGRR